VDVDLTTGWLQNVHISTKRHFGRMKGAGRGRREWRAEEEEMGQKECVVNGAIEKRIAVRCNLSS
jgi:hypothetical protein